MPLTDSLLFYALGHFFTTFCIFHAHGCSLIQLDSHFQILGGGFHRRLLVSTNLSSTRRLINCQIVYHFQIPSGAFLDVDAQFVLERSRRPPAHCLTTTTIFDVEKAHRTGAPSAQLFPILFHSNKIPTKSFLLTDKLEFAVHLRYHSPTGDSFEEGFATVEFQPPRIYLRCEQNQSLLEEPSCRQQIERVPCECKHPELKCPAFRLRPEKEMMNLRAHVPIGDERQAWLAITATFAVILVGTFFIARATRTNTKSPSEKPKRRKAKL